MSTLAEIGTLNRLTHLGLHELQSCDFELLKKLDNLKNLRLANVNLKGLENLRCLSTLYSLVLKDYTKITLDPILQLKQLRRIELKNSPISTEECSILKKQFPGLIIIEKK